ncbi:MAG: TonB-dependent receptor [Candidatus Loosdrechtia sp.]|uniref:TonB-dependent receptor n=1 Tax=Candidatus Loosdrechtia sp. TaxID=3101272 RepID=UPI003A74CE87|nr:MAG: TonB-dependent receptor [Candidatus Jettenia sp. AMX2]
MENKALFAYGAPSKAEKKRNMAGSAATRTWYLLILLLSVLLSCSVLVAKEIRPEEVTAATESKETAGKKPAGTNTAKKEDVRLEEVVITATRTERTTEEIPASVSTVTKEDIKNTRMFNLREALTGIPGVQAETRNGAYDARLIIRGAGLKARFGIREIMVLLDGVPITDPDGMTRLDFVDPQLVERIDIVKGPNSTLYGANAVGGVINIITKSPFEELKSVKAGYGNYNAQMYNVIYGNHIGNTYFTFAGSRRSTDSWREWNEFTTNQGSLKIGHMFDTRTTLEANISLTQADLQLAGTLTKDQFTSDITQLTSDPWRHMGRYSEILYSSLKFEKEIDNIRIKPLVYFQTWDHFHPVTGLINDGGSNVYGADIQTDIIHSIAGIRGVLTAGVTGQMDKSSGDKFTYRDFVTGAGGRILHTTSDAKGDLAETGKDTATKWGIYVQESLRPSDRWIVDLGIRYDQVRFDIDTERFMAFNWGAGRYVDKQETIDVERTFEYVSPRIGVVYKLSSIFNLYGNISTGFQTPQASEISLNPDLDPSKTYNYETGLKARFEGGHGFDLSLFHMTVKDDIVQTIETGNISSYSNAGKSRKRGVEFSGNVQTLPGLFHGVSYAYSDFRFTEFIEPVREGAAFVFHDRSGNRFPYIPKHQYGFFTDYRHPSGIRFRIDTNTWGKYYVDNANSETFSGYDFLTNVLVGYERKNLDITFDVYNVFDMRYAMEVTKDTDLRFRPGAPLTMMIRLTYKF